MRNFLIGALFVVVVAFAVCAQSAPDPRRILGAPATESYKPDPSVTVTVNYDSAGKVCDIRLNGPYFKIHPLVEKLVPPDVRGRQLGMPRSLIPVMNCCESWRYDYERVVMSFFTGNGKDSFRFIFKGSQCVVPQPEETKALR